MEHLTEEDLPYEFVEFLCPYRQLKDFPENISPVNLLIPENRVDHNKKSIFGDYLKKNGMKIIDEIHHSKCGVGFIENKKNSFPLIDFRKFNDFRGYYENKYKNYPKINFLGYCVICAKSLGSKKEKELKVNKNKTISYHNGKPYSIGKTKSNKHIPIYFIKGGR